ncbi:MAG: hypothetical protein AAF696_34460 [Bacteroidota bacterium]
MQLIDKSGSGLIPFQDSIAWSKDQDQYCHLQGEEVLPLSKDAYMRAYAGEAWEKVGNTLGPKSNGLGTACSLAKNGELFSIHFQNGILHIWSERGELNEVLELNEIFTYGHLIYDIEFQAPHFLWLAFPTGQTVAQFDLKDKIETFRIGEFTFEKKYEPLSYPETLFSTQEELFIPCMGTGEIYKLKFETKELRLYKTTDKPLWEFVKVAMGEFVRIENSIFKLEE